MSVKAIRILFLSVLFFTTALPHVLAQTENILTLQPVADEQFYIPFERFLTLLPDPSGKLTVYDVSGKEFSEKFRKGANRLNADSKIYWLRLQLKSDLPNDKQLLSYIQGSVVDLYEELTPGKFNSHHSGLLVPIPERDQKNRFGHDPYTSITVKARTTQTYYWRVDNTHFPVLSPHTNHEASLSSYEYVLAKGRNSLFFFIAVCSILFGLAIYHLVTYLVTSDRAYLYFTVYSLSACLYIMYFKGYLLELFFASIPALHYGFAFAATCIAFHIALLMYVRQYVNVAKDFPVWDKVLQVGFTLVVLCVGIVSFLESPSLAIPLSFALMVPVVLLEAFGFAMLARKHPLTKNYLAAFTLLTLGFIANGVFTVLGIEQGIWDFGDIGLLGLQILLAVGLALRINLLNKEKHAAQAELIHQLKENHLLQQHATTELEEKVTRRTMEIEQQNEKLTRLNLLKDKLFSIISHDIKGPLNQLSSTLYMMERDMITKEEIKQLVPQIRTNLSANTNFINELLTWAKSQLEGAKLNPQAANLQELIETNFQLLKPIADAKGIQMQNHLAKPLAIYADVEMIKSVVRNLSANAIKFTNPQGVIKITVGVDKSFASISVTDNGKGISTENQKKLFGSQIFTTLGTANEKGTGIGLLLCKDFVEKNGGRIWVESEEGKGSSFAFTVPLHKN